MKKGELKEERVEMYKELLALMEDYKTRERAAEGVDRMLTLSTSVTTRQNSSKLGFVLAAPGDQGTVL